MIPFIIHARVSDPDAKNVTLVSEAVKDEANLHVYSVYMAQMEYSRPFTIARERREIGWRFSGGRLMPRLPTPITWRKPPN